MAVSQEASLLGFFQGFQTLYYSGHRSTTARGAHTTQGDQTQVEQSWLPSAGMRSFSAKGNDFPEKENILFPSKVLVTVGMTGGRCSSLSDNSPI